MPRLRFALQPWNKLVGNVTITAICKIYHIFFLQAKRLGCRQACVYHLLSGCCWVLPTLLYDTLAEGHAGQWQLPPECLDLVEAVATLIRHAIHPTLVAAISLETRSWCFSSSTFFIHCSHYHSIGDTQIVKKSAWYYIPLTLPYIWRARVPSHYNFLHLSVLDIYCCPTNSILWPSNYGDNGQFIPINSSGHHLYHVGFFLCLCQAGIAW